MPAQKRSLAESTMEDGDTSQHLFHPRHAKQQPHRDLHFDNDQQHQQQEQHQEQEDEDDEEEEEEQEQEEEEEEEPGEEEDEDDEDDEEEQEEEEDGEHHSHDKDKSQGYVSAFSLVLLRGYMVFQWPNWVFSTGLRSPLPSRLFMFSSFLLFSLCQIPTKPHLLTLKKNPSTISHSFLFHTHCF